MFRRLSLTIISVCLVNFCFAQKDKDSLAIDTGFIDYADLFSELEAFIDSISAPPSFTLVNLGIGQVFLPISQMKKRRQLQPGDPFILHRLVILIRPGLNWAPALRW